MSVPYEDQRLGIRRDDLIAHERENQELAQYALFRGDGLLKRHLSLAHCMNPLSSVCQTHVVPGPISHPRYVIMPE
jgi:hypothetical protein